MIAILKKELLAYFGNWTAWVIIAIFGLIGSLFLFFFENNFNFFEIGSASMHSYFVLVPWLFIFLIPALSMKSLAEEQQSGTLGWLFSQPLQVWEIIAGKFLSIWIVSIFCMLSSLVYIYILSVLSIPEGNLDGGLILGGYFGVSILAGAFIAVGILASSFSANQVMAYLIGVFLNFLWYFGIEQLASYKLLGGADYILQNLGFYHHYMPFTRGLLDTKDVFYFILIVILGLKCAEHFVKNKR